MNISRPAGPEVITPSSAETGTHTADASGTPLNLIRLEHQVPPYANDVRAERRRREREQVRNRHRGTHAAAIEFNDRMWVEYVFPCFKFPN